MTKFKGLIEKQMHDMIPSDMEEIANVMRKNQGRSDPLGTITYPNTSIGQFAITSKDGLMKLPPVIGAGLANLTGSDVSNFQYGVVFDKSSPSTGFSGILYYIPSGTLQVPQIDDKYIYLMVHHGPVTDKNVSEGLSLIPIQTKCFTNISLSDIANFTGNNSATTFQGKVRFNDGSVVNISQVSPYLVNCKRVNIVTSFVSGNMTNLIYNKADSGWNKQDIISKVEIFQYGQAPQQNEEAPVINSNNTTISGSNISYNSTVTAGGAFYTNSSGSNGIESIISGITIPSAVTLDPAGIPIKFDGVNTQGNFVLRSNYPSSNTTFNSTTGNGIKEYENTSYRVKVQNYNGSGTPSGTYGYKTLIMQITYANHTPTSIKVNTYYP